LFAEFRLDIPTMPLPISSRERNPITKTSRDLIVKFLSIAYPPKYVT
jgi:hypothetical protein